MKETFFDSKGDQVFVTACPRIGILDGDITIAKETSEDIQDDEYGMYLHSYKEYLSDGQNSSLMVDKEQKVINLVINTDENEYVSVSWTDEEFDQLMDFFKKFQ